MRPRTKIDACRMSLTLSGPAREWLNCEAKRRQISRTQVVEELIKGAGVAAGPLAVVRRAGMPTAEKQTKRRRA